MDCSPDKDAELKQEPDEDKQDKQDQDDLDENALSARGNGKGGGKRDSGKAKAKAKAKGKAKAKAGAGGAVVKRSPASSCICPGCPFPKYQGSRFCSAANHKKAWDNMVYQRKSRKDITDEDRKNFDESMKDDGIAGKAVLEFSRDNPPEMKRKGLVDFARFERVKGHRLSNKTSAGNVPMTEKAFYKHCENVLGLSEEESQEYWREFDNDKSLQRDNNGFRGAERLWLPLHEMESKERDHFVENRAVEGSGDIKAPTIEDRRILEAGKSFICLDIQLVICFLSQWFSGTISYHFKFLKE